MKFNFRYVRYVDTPVLSFGSIQNRIENTKRLITTWTTSNARFAKKSLVTWHRFDGILDPFIKVKPNINVAFVNMKQFTRTGWKSIIGLFTKRKVKKLRNVKRRFKIHQNCSLVTIASLRRCLALS